MDAGERMTEWLAGQGTSHSAQAAAHIGNSRTSQLARKHRPQGIKGLGWRVQQAAAMQSSAQAAALHK